jgi:glycerol-3-phosphate acyltransferase PlsX
MGTDEAPASEIVGAIQAIEDSKGDLTIVLVGARAVIERGLELHDPSFLNHIEVVHAPDRILPGDSPAQAVRKRPNSSIVTGVGLIREGKVDGFVSAGSTGAVMAASLIILRPLPGVDRPAVGTLLPTAGRPTLMLDAGANIDCKPHHLLQFARLGAIYAQDLMGVAKPRVGLLNIGEEPGKGDELALATYDLLQQSGLHFVGNIEGRDIIRGACDVLVCDGFVGNVLLKFYESVAHFMIDLLSKEMERTGIRMELDEAFRVLDYSEYGGAPLLGVNGVSIICHGQSPPKAIRNAIHVAQRAVRSRMVEHIARDVGQDPAGHRRTEA